MRYSRPCAEALERRCLLNAALEVWAGNTDLRGSDAWDHFMNIDQQGYTKLGESNAAGSTVAFTGSGNYKYFVIAARGNVQIDAIRNSGGSYISSIAESTNATSVANATGAPNGGFASVGTRTSDSTYAGYMLVIAPATWQGLTITTGAIEPQLRFWLDLDRLYIGGQSTPYGIHSDMMVQHNGLIEAARVHTPTGRWIELGAEEPDVPELGYERFFDTEAQALAEYGHGMYQLWVQTPLGERTFDLEVFDTPFPSQVPSISSFSQGATNVPTAFTPAMPAITDGRVLHVSLHIENRYEDDVYDEYTGAGGTLPSVLLSAGESYLADVDFGFGNWHSTPLGQEFGFNKGNEANYIFATTGFTQSTPDIQGVRFEASAQTRNPGDEVMLDISVRSIGGMAYSTTSPVRHLIGLSSNKTIGDADDIVLFAPIEPGYPKGWAAEGMMSFTIPENARAGQYYVFGQMDTTNAVAESNESNNIAWSATAGVTIPTQPITLEGGRLTIAGTASGDVISLSLDALAAYARIGDVTRSFARAEISSVLILGNAGNDSITIGDGFSGVTVRGGDGNDTITGGNGDDFIYGDEGHDSIAGNDGSDTIYGNGGDDTIAGGLKRDSIMGGLGNDVITAGDGPDSVYGGDGTDILRGGKGADYIEGRGKADTIWGGLGNDVILGGAGADLIYGEDGDDRIDVGPSSAFRDTLDGGLGTDLGLYDGDDVATSIEGLLA